MFELASFVREENDTNVGEEKILLLMIKVQMNLMKKKKFIEM